MKVTLKLHPKSQHDMAVLSQVLSFIAQNTEIETEDKKDVTGLAKVEGPVTQEKIKEAVSTYVAPKPPAVEQPKVEAPKQEAPQPAKVVGAPKQEAPPPPAAQSKVDMSALRAKTQEKIMAGFRDQVKAILAEFNTPAVTALPEEHWVAFNSKLDAIK